MALSEPVLLDRRVNGIIGIHVRKVDGSTAVVVAPWCLHPDRSCVSRCAPWLFSSTHTLG